MLEDLVEAIRSLLQAPAACELIHEFVAQAREGRYGPGREIDVPLQGRSDQSGTEPFAHRGFAGFLRECNRQRPLLVLWDVIVGVTGTVIHLDAGEGELSRHLD